MNEPKTNNENEQTSSKPEDIEQLKKERDDYLNGWKRALADLDNFKKQLEKEKEVFIKFANVDLILKLLPILNFFDEAENAIPEEQKNSSWVLGIIQIKKQLEDLLKAEGVERINRQDKFDPSLHEAISYEESEFPEGQIIGEMSSGWKYFDKVLLPARVRVSKGKSTNGN